jgi:hypothetical protein
MKHKFTFFSKEIMRLLVLPMMTFFIFNANAQTTLNTTAVTGWLNNNGSGTVTFNFENTNGYPILITSIEGITGTAGANTAELWTNPIPVNTPAAPFGLIAPSTGWTQVATGSFTGVANSVDLTTQPFLSGLSVVIPAGATLGMAVFALGQRYHSMVAPNIPLTTVSGGGCNILMGTNISWGGGSPGASGAQPGFTPRGWLGKITFIPFGPCIDPPTPGTTVATNTNVCSGQLTTLSLTGGTGGTSQTYQWESSTNLGGPYNPITGATNAQYANNPTSTAYYRCQVTCGVNTLPSSELLITVPPLFPGGSYTIDFNTPTGGSNFQTFTEAVSAISCGIGGPIDFTVTSGTYNEQISLPSTIGSSVLNTVTFNCNNSNLSFTSADASKRYVLQLNGADYITFNDLVINATGTTTTNYGWGIHLTGGADNNSFNTCVVNTNAGTPANSINLYYPLVINGSGTVALTGGQSGSNNSFLDCTLNGGYNGVILNGTGVGTEAQNNTFINTQVKDFYQYGFQMLYQKGVYISGSDISRPTKNVFTTTSGIFISTGCLNSLVENNRVHNLFDGLTTSTSACYPLYCIADATLSEPNRFINNIVYNINNTGINYGIYNAGGDYMNAYHNTISLDAPIAATGATYGFYQTTAAVGINIRNNIVTIGRGGTAAKVGLYYNTTASAIVSDNNAVFMNPAAGGTKNYGNYSTTGYATLAAWQGANLLSPFDLSSVAADPLYTNAAANDYTPTALATNNIGGTVGVALDINGVTRCPNSDPGAIEYALPGLDGDIAWVSPTSPTTAGLKTITVSVANNLSTTITDLTLTYTDGITPVTETFSGLNIGICGAQTFSFTTQYNVVTSSTLRAYINSVNGVSDASQLNDTTGVQNICIALNGVYTIDAGSPASSTNFQSMTSAGLALICGGVSGPVTFDVVAGSGPYTSQLTIPQIAGVSATNTITVNGNGNVVTYNGVGDYHTIRLAGADYMTFNDLVINATGATNGFCLSVGNESNNNNFNNCTFNASTSSTSSLSTGIAFSSSTTSPTGTGNNGNNNVFTNCTIDGGYYGITVYGNSTGSGNITGNQLINCTVRNYYFYGVYIAYASNTIVQGCTVERPTRATVSTGYGIYLTTNAALSTIERNRVRNLFGGVASTVTSASYGIYHLANPAIGSENRIINNVVSDIRKNTGLLYAIYNTGSNVQIYHNTVSIDDPSIAATGATYGIGNTNATGTAIRNNIVTVNRGGTGKRYCLYYSTLPASSDYNVLQKGTGALDYIGFANATDYLDLSSFTVAVSPRDANTVEADPDYTDPLVYNYKPGSTVINNLCTPVGVGLDITGAVRSGTTPDPGAYEFDVLPYDVSVLAMTAPGTGGCYSNAETVSVNIRNEGSNTIDFSTDPVVVTCLVGGTATATLTGTPTGTLASGATLSVALSPTLDMSTLGGYTFSISASLASDGDLSNNSIPMVNRTAAIQAGTVSGSQPSLCLSGASNLSLSGQAGGSIQWQESTSATGPWTNVGTGTSTYATGTITQTMYYQAVSTCNTNVVTSNVYTVTVANPVVTSTTPGARCGFGSVNLEATGSAGTTLNWYSSPTSTTPIGSGSPFATPSIASTSTFYVAANEGGVGAPYELLTTSAAGNGATGVLFDVTILNPIRIDSFSNFLTVAGSTCAIFYRAGTGYGGNQSSNAGWTQIGGVVTVPTLTSPLTVIPINVNLTLSPGLYSFALLTSSTNSYTDGTSLGAVYVQDANVQIRQGYGGGGTPPNNIAFVNSPRIWNGRLYYSTLGCESPKAAVLATVSTAPAITASTPSPSICPATSSTVSVSSTNPDYTYSWTAAPAGFTASGVGPHTVSPTTTTKYYVNAVDNTVGPFAGCSNIDSVSIITAPALLGGTISTPVTDYCQSGTPTLTNAGAEGGAIQWQESTSASGPWNNVGSGATTFAPGTLTQTMYYRVEVSCDANTFAYSNTLTITVNTPSIVSTTGGTICGTNGSTTLNATVNAGATANWYAAPSGGTPVLSGSTSYTTPTIATTTTYYVAASSGGYTASTGLAAALPTATSGAGTTNFGLVFDVTAPCIINSVVIYPRSTTNGTPGTVTVQVINSSSVVLHTTTINVIGSSTGATAVTVPLNFAMVPGTNYKMRPAFTGISGLSFEPSASAPAGNYGYPFVLPGALTIVTSTLTAAPNNTPRNDLYYYFYNWQVSTGCESARVPVIATVAPNPTVTATPSSITVCSGDNVTLNGGGADTYSWTGGITDNTPFVATTTTTYEVTGTDANGCTNTATAVVTVNNCNTTLNLTALIQGYWLGTEMSEVLSFQSEPTTLGACDSIDVSLVDSATLNVLVTKRAVLNKNGLANVVFPGSFTGSYYIKLAHRNAMETWSKYTVSMSGTPSYNFTTAADQAYGDNQVEVSPGIFALYSGDIIKDANEAIELTDIAQLESDNSNFAFGYQASDINGDGGVDLGDFPLVEANVNGFIFANHP